MPMLQAHSLLWHYLWIAPQVLALTLVAALLRGNFRRRYPIFFSYLVFSTVEGICLYVFDVSPRVSPLLWWQAFLAGTIIEGLLKFALIGELVHHLLHPWPSIAKLGRNLITGSGVVLVLGASVAAAFAVPDNTPRVIVGAHIISEAIYLAAAGLIASIFVLAAYFHIPWESTNFGIAVGAGFTWCLHLVVWALVAGGVVRNQVWEDLAMEAAYQVSVLIWCYYLLIPREVSIQYPAPAVPEGSLEMWNRELERLLQ
jgi:hypothetical protein